MMSQRTWTDIFQQLLHRLKSSNMCKLPEVREECKKKKVIEKKSLRPFPNQGIVTQVKKNGELPQ